MIPSLLAARRLALAVTLFAFLSFPHKHAVSNEITTTQTLEERIQAGRQRARALMEPSRAKGNLPGGPTTSPVRSLSGSPNTSAIGTATVSGTVVNVATGNPIPRAFVELRGVAREFVPHLPERNRSVLAFRHLANSSSWTTTTNEQGHFLFDHIPDGLFVVQASARLSGRALHPVPRADHGPDVDIQNGETTSLVVELFPGYTVHGRVIDQATSRPLPGALIGLGGFKPETAVAADGDGRFTFTHVRATYFAMESAIFISSVEARHPGYTTPPRLPLILPRKAGPFDPNDLEVDVTIELVPERR